MQEQDYNKTLNLPVTEFPMRAGLPQRERGCGRIGTRSTCMKS